MAFREGVPVRKLLVLPLFLLVAGCNYALFNANAPTDQGGGSGAAFDKALAGSDVPSFDFIETEILAKNNTCTECHKWATNYAGVRDYVKPGSSLDSVLVKRLKNMNGNMPKDKPALDEKAVEVLKLWIDAGANEAATPKPTSGSTTTTTLPANPVFSDVAEHVFKNNCNSCHRADSPSKAKEFPFQKYSELMALVSDDGPVVTPGNLETSVLWTDVSTADMPPKNAIAAGNATALTPEQIDLVKRWIEQGARESLDNTGATTTTTTTTTSTTTTLISVPSTTTSSTSTTTTLAIPNIGRVTFADVSKAILEVNCVKCHSAGGLSAGAAALPFTDYAKMLKLKGSDFQVLVPGNLAGSALWTDVETNDMPPIKAINKGLVPAMTGGQKAMLKQWIESGAPEN